MTRKTWKVDYDFLVIIEPCEIQSYLDSLTAADIVTNIGAPAQINVSSYDFQQSPNCAYPELVTVTNLPPFITHNDVDRSFSVPLISDLSLIGKYTAHIHSIISVPDDHLKSSYTPWVVEYDFDIYIGPCLVDTYESTLDAGPISYRIGDPTLTDGRYSF